MKIIPNKIVEWTFEDIILYWDQENILYSFMEDSIDHIP